MNSTNVCDNQIPMNQSNAIPMNNLGDTNDNNVAISEILDRIASDYSSNVATIGTINSPPDEYEQFGKSVQIWEVV